MFRPFTRALILLSLLVLSIFGERQFYSNNSQNIAIKPLALNPDKPDTKKVGDLEFLGAWELGSDNRDFGGISGLAIQDDGRFLAVSDAGTLIGFGLSGDESADRPFIAPMPGAFGGKRNYEDRDSESLEHDLASGRFWVSYEGKHAIRRFSPSFSRTEATVRPKAMQEWGSNSGAEALLRLPDGRFLVFSEGHDREDGSYEALHFSGDPTEIGSDSFAFGYFPPERHKITDAKMLPDGRVLTLNRKFDLTGLSATLAVFDPAEIIRGEAIRPAVIAKLESPLLVDNMEGLAVVQQGEDVIIWIISDDNFNIVQRTLLMKFRLNPGKPSPKRGDKEALDTKKPVGEKAPGFDAI